MAASPELNKTSTVIKQFVVDYTTATFEPLTEHEVGGLDYRYVYGNDRLSVNITGVETSSGNLIENGNQIRLYYHMDYLGTADYLTSPVSQKVTSWTHYNEWGEITHNAVLKTGQRELDLVKRYATHDYDAVLGMYYAKARMYDAENRRFASVDPVKGWITEPMTMVQYLYVVDNPLRYIDPLGLERNPDPMSTYPKQPVFPPNSTPVEFYINGRLSFKDNGFDYVANWNSSVYVIGMSGKDDELLNAMGIRNTKLKVDSRGSYRQINGQKVYYEKYECVYYLPVRKAAEAAGVADTLSWWKENGNTVITLNTIMKDAPVKVVRNGRAITISIYASFTGDYNLQFDNYEAAKELYGDRINKNDYQSTYTYAEEIARGVVSNWSGPYYPHDKNGCKYDDFGDYSSVHVTVNFYGKQPSPNGIYSPAPSVSNTQEYIYINVASTMPTSETDEAGKKTINGSAGTAEESYENWSIDKPYHMDICDYWVGWDNGGREEKSVFKFRQTAAHEMGHAMGLGDAYGNDMHAAAPITDEMRGEIDMMWGNGQVSSNNIEMLLEAFKTNTWQEFVNSANNKKSSVIRLP